MSSLVAAGSTSQGLATKLPPFAVPNLGLPPWGAAPPRGQKGKPGSGFLARNPRCREG